MVFRLFERVGSGSSDADGGRGAGGEQGASTGPKRTLWWVLTAAAATGLPLLAWAAFQTPVQEPAPASNAESAARASSAARDAKTAPPPRVPPSKPLPAEFRTLLARDVFLGPRPPAVDRKAKVERASEPRSAFVLRGVTVQGGRVVAIVEDVVGRRVLRLKRGDAVAGGTVEQVGFDGVEYSAGPGGGHATRVPIGNTFSGEAAAAVAPTSGPTKTAGSKEPGRKKNQTAELPPT